MIASLVTLTSMLVSVYLAAQIHVWLAAIWLVWLLVGITSFMRNLGRKSGVDPWYMGFVLMPVIPFAFIFGFTSGLTAKISKYFKISH